MGDPALWPADAEEDGGQEDAGEDGDQDPFLAAVAAGVSCRELFRLRNAADVDEFTMARWNEVLREIGCSPRRQPAPTDCCRAPGQAAGYPNEVSMTKDWASIRGAGRYSDTAEVSICRG